MTAAAQYLPPRPKPVPNATGMFGGRTTCLACGQGPVCRYSGDKKKKPRTGEDGASSGPFGGTDDGRGNIPSGTLPLHPPADGTGLQTSNLSVRFVAWADLDRCVTRQQHSHFFV